MRHHEGDGSSLTTVGRSSVDIVTVNEGSVSLGEASDKSTFISRPPAGSGNQPQFSINDVMGSIPTNHASPSPKAFAPVDQDKTSRSTGDDEDDREVAVDVEEFKASTLRPGSQGFAITSLSEGTKPGSLVLDSVAPPAHVNNSRDGLQAPSADNFPNDSGQQPLPPPTAQLQIPQQFHTPLAKASIVPTHRSDSAAPRDPLHLDGSVNSRASLPKLVPKTTENTPSSGKVKWNGVVNSTGNAPGGVSRPVCQDVEVLMSLPFAPTQPVDNFFARLSLGVRNRAGLSNPSNPTNLDLEGQPCNEEEMLLEQFAQYTDDDSIFSSGSSVIEYDPCRFVNNPLRGRALDSVHSTLQLHALPNGCVQEEKEWDKVANVSWLYQIHRRALALQYSSFFVFPPCWTPRVMVYNFMHHWLFELVLFGMILGYSLFQASWARYPLDDIYMRKPSFMMWADVFYTLLFGFELLLRLFASGFLLHPRAFFRSPWHWLDTAVLIMMILNCTDWQQLWNFTAWRLLRCIMCLTHVRFPVRMKLLAKSLLRSTNKLCQVTLLLLYFVFFFGLLGLHLFQGTLHSRCVNDFTGEVTSQICRSVATDEYWFYWGHHCPEDYSCVTAAFPNPHYDFRSFDDIGHAMLSAFQIFTFQGWTGLLAETNDGLAVMAFLYYAFVIIVCAWIIPALYCGVFVEKIELTNHLFALKQIELLDSMITEQRQRMNRAVHLHDYVQRDEQGCIPYYPTYVTPAKDAAPPSPLHSSAVAKHHKSIHHTRWNDEQRLQLHLSLTRQRDVAERAEEKRVLVVQNKRAARHGVAASVDSRHCAGAGSRDGNGTCVVIMPPVVKRPGPDNFALGGRVGEVQHHRATYTIGASRQTSVPFAQRQECEAGQLQFLGPYSNPNHAATEASAEPERLGLAASGNLAMGGRGGCGDADCIHSPSEARRPQLPVGPDSNIGVTLEPPGVVPYCPPAQRPRADDSLLKLCNISMDGCSADTTNPLQVVLPKEQAAKRIAVNDPEGGDFTLAESCADKLNIIRNILHMFTEGYPRIVSQYLVEYWLMHNRYSLLPLNYTNRYEEATLQKLRRIRASERAAERRHGMSLMPGASELDVDADSSAGGKGGDAEEMFPSAARWMGAGEGLVLGHTSPVRIAQNIMENAPLTPFRGFIFVLIFLNGVFNATRFATMPSSWEDGTFVLGVLFSAIFALELLIKVVALGPSAFCFDLFNPIESLFIILSFFQLGFSRANTLSLFNWIRFLKLFRMTEIYPLRHATRVLLYALPGIICVLVLFTLYLFMWLLLGMSFFGSRLSLIQPAGDPSAAPSADPSRTRANFESFSHAAYAIAQAFSVNRDQWLYLSWDGMRMRGGYTIMYFIATVVTVYILRFFLMATFLWAWQSQESEGDGTAPAEATAHAEAMRPKDQRLLPWFDFSVWRSFKHIHGGFERRDVAPDEVYFINDDMRRQLRLVEARDRSYKNAYEHECAERAQLYSQTSNSGAPGDLTLLANEGRAATSGSRSDAPHYITVGGQLFRHQGLFDDSFEDSGEVVFEKKAQLSFARESRIVPAFIDDKALHGKSTAALLRARGVFPIFNPLTSQPPSALINDNTPPLQLSLPVSAADAPSLPSKSLEENVGLEHVLLPGPRLRYKSVLTGGRRAFEVCLDCNAYKQMPLRAPPGVAQRTADQLHAEHCHMAAVRSSRQLVLNVLVGYARMQSEHEVAPTKEMIETVLGQAWSCGMLLFENIDNLSCVDLPPLERNWDRVLQALEVQQWLLGLRIGEEQVGRATLAYVLAHQQKEDAVTRESIYACSWKEYSFMVFSPSNSFRVAITALLNSRWFEALSLYAIFIGSIFLAAYTPGDGSRDLGGSYNDDKHSVLCVLDDIVVVFFVVEMVLKWISAGVVLPVGRAYFWYRWNLFDFFIVIVSLVSWGSEGTFLRSLKALRCFRILGPLRYWTANTTMMHLAHTLWDCIPLLANICLLMLMHCTVWSILFVSMFANKMSFCSNSIYTERHMCEILGFHWTSVQRNFDNFYESLLTTFELSTGAEWLDVIYSAVDSWSTERIPAVNRHPYKGLVFVAYYYIAHFILFTLFASAVVYCYLTTRNASEGGSSAEKQLWRQMQKLVLRIKPKVRMLPRNSSLSRASHDLVCARQFELFMALVLFANMITMALEWYNMSHAQKLALDVLQWVFVGIFALEVLLRLVAHGPRFFTRWAYCWDLLVTCLSFIQIGLNTTHTHQLPFNVNVLRLLRMQRVLSLVDAVTPFQTHLAIFNHMLRGSVQGLINVTLLYMLAVYVFAIVGLHLFGYIVPFGGFIDDKYNNFSTFVNALIMVFRLSTLENWSIMLRNSMDHGNYCNKANHRCGLTNWAPVYYVAIVLCFYLILSTLYLAVIVDNYIIAVRMHGSLKKLDGLYRFCNLWSRRDPNAKRVLPASDLLSLLQELRPPLGLSNSHNRVEVLRLFREYDIPVHYGYVYYDEVLQSLARRAMALSFHGAEELVYSGKACRLVWGLSEHPLGPSPYAWMFPYAGNGGNVSCTLLEYCAVSYIQAAYRRDRAMRDYYLAKSRQWHRCRAICDKIGLPYKRFGFGSVRLDCPDPRQEGQRHGFSLPEVATRDHGAVYASKTSGRQLQQTSLGNQENPAVLFPSHYTTAIQPIPKLFGPEVPNAIRRHERRSDKFQRRRREESGRHQAQVEEERAASHHTAGDVAPDSTGMRTSYLDPIGIDTSTLCAEPTARDFLAMSHHDGVRRVDASSVVKGRQRKPHNLGNSNHQLPLGTDPQVLRIEQTQRHARELSSRRSQS